MIEISAERPDDGAAIEALLDRAFGANRHEKRSYTYRQGVDPIPGLCLTARESGAVIGTIRCWPVAIGAAPEPAILVGPVAVDLAHQRHKLGARLMQECLATAREVGYRVAVLVGDLAYYGRFGFNHADRFGIVMDWENPNRVLTLPLAATVSLPAGSIQPWRSVRRISLAA